MNMTVRILIAIAVLASVAFLLFMDAPIERKAMHEIVIPHQAEARGQSTKLSVKHDILDSEIYWLARGMEEEDGVGWCDEDILKIGTVIANRRDSDLFPDTYKGVLMQEGQYAPFYNGYTLTKPNDHYIYLAMRIEEGYRSFGPDVLFQALFVQGEIVDAVYDECLGTTTYFCK